MDAGVGLYPPEPLLDPSLTPPRPLLDPLLDPSSVVPDAGFSFYFVIVTACALLDPSLNLPDEECMPKRCLFRESVSSHAF